MKEHFRAIYCSYAEIFFLQGAVLGTLFFAVTLISPNVALAGILSVLAAYAFARFIRMEPSFLESGFYTYNPLLVGLSLGYLFRLTPHTVFFVVSAGIFTFLLTILMANLFQTYLKLPILSLPFVIVSSIAYLASLRYSNLLIASPQASSLLSRDLGLPLWLAGYFRSLGAILFAPSVLVGLLFAALILVSSRILFMLSMLGYLVGTFARAMLAGSALAAYRDITSFNFMLIAMAVGGVFLIPSPGSYLMAMIAVAISTLFIDSLTVFGATFSIPVFTLPFNIISLSFIYVLGLMNYPRVARWIGRTPEETLENHQSSRRRYVGADCTIALPFAGKWTVWQGFDGEWTHKEEWRHACDFVITDEDGKTHSGSGSSLDDYYCFQKPVLSPVRGRVVTVVNNLPDNPAGEVSEEVNWGNLVILEDPRRFCVEISHFAENSIQVNEGDWVERGALLGKCGNSGYSPQPHLHVQVQATDRIGASTIPFSFVSYSDGKRCHSNDLPEEGQQVEPLLPDKRLDRLTTFLFDDQLEFDFLDGGKKVGSLSLEVKMAPDGTFYFESSSGRLYFGRHEGTFYFYRTEGNDPCLRFLFQALPRLPLSYRDDLEWEDYLPIGLLTRGPKRVFTHFLSAFRPSLASVCAQLRFKDRDHIATMIESRPFNISKEFEIVLDGSKGFSSIRSGSLELRKRVSGKSTRFYSTSFKGAQK